MSELEKVRTVTLDPQRVRAQRLRTGLSREVLATRSIGVDALSIATIKRAEVGKAVYANSAASLARLLGVSLGQLLPEVASGPPNSLKIPHRTSLAVMPFQTGGTEEHQRVFADGFVEELINRLSSSWFPVIARGSSFSWQAETAEPSDAHRLLGADYLVRGSIRSDGASYRTSVQLIEAETARVVWAANFDTEGPALFQLRDRIVAEIVSEVGHRVLQEEVSREASVEPRDLDAWRTALRGAWHFHRCTAEDMRQARSLLQQALAEDPQLVFARYLLIMSHQHDLLNQWTDPRVSVGEIRRCSVEFERLAPGNPWMYVATAYSALGAGDRSDATSRLLEALHADGNSVHGHSLYGQVLAMGGNSDQGLHEMELARTLSPRDPGLWVMLMTTSLAHFAAGRYDVAADWARKSVSNRPQVPFTYATLAAALAHDGKLEEAKLAIAKMRARQGALGVRGVGPLIQATDPEIAKRFLDGLRLAGMPDDA